MGIVNVTPDSFSDGGKYFSLESSYQHSTKLLNEGADILDIGGESSRPGAHPISVEDELKRVLPLINKINSNFPQAVVSIDTTKSEVAEAAINAGAKIINDISGLSNDKDMVNIVSKYGVPVVIMHMQGNPATMQDNPKYDDLLYDIKDFFKQRIKYANNFGIKKEQIILDPGIGFGKMFQDNFKLINHLDKFCELGLPVLIGPSRKSFIGTALKEDPQYRLEGTLAAVAAGILRGAQIVRVHDVAQVRKVVRITDLIRKA